jgi:hypothetical protein
MATKLHPKQINQPLYASVNITGFAFPAAATAVVTSALTTALASAGRGAVSVPLQVGSATTQGVITSAGNNTVDVWLTSTKNPFADASGNEVFGRLTEAAGVYTLSLFSLVAGVETAFTSPAQNIDFQFSYCFAFDTLPEDALVRSSTKHVGDDPASVGFSWRLATLTPTALNTLPALPVAYNAGALGGIFMLEVNGQTLVPADGFSVSGTTVTLTPATIGFDITTTDAVRAVYTV